MSALGCMRLRPTGATLPIETLWLKLHVCEVMRFASVKTEHPLGGTGRMRLKRVCIST